MFIVPYVTGVLKKNQGQGHTEHSSKTGCHVCVYRETEDSWIAQYWVDSE